MASISHIRQQVSLVPDEEMRAVCLRIVEEVAKRSARNNIGLWTIDVISKWVGRDAEDHSLIRSVQMLSARQDAQLLEVHFIFFDPGEDDSHGEKVDDDEVASAYRTGYLIHPVSGDPVEQFEDYLLPYFVPAQALTSQ